MLKFSLLLIGIFLCFGMNAQSIRLVAKSNEKTIELKWFTNSLTANEGVNIYRQSTDGSWSKINSAPIRKGDYYPTAAEIQSDPDLKEHLELLKATKPLESFGLLLASMEAIKSTPFARAAGLYYSDNLLASTTGYKVALLVQGKETAFAEYNLADHQNDYFSLNEIEFEQRLKKVYFKWLVEDSKFYAVNVYRSVSPDSIGELITKNPIIPSKVKNEAGVQEYPKWFLEDRLVAEKNTYYYRLVGLGFFNQELKISEPIKVRIKDETAPIPPVLKSKTEDPEGFAIFWEQLERSDDQSGFEVFLTDRNDTIFHSYSTETISLEVDSFFVKLNKVGTYSVKVASKDAEGNYGYSNEFVLDFLDKTPPMKPINVQLNTDSTLIRVTWDKNTDADILGYKIYRGINGVQNSMALQNSTPFAENFYVDKLPKNSKNSFSYFVIAIDSALNESVMSEIASKRLLDVVPPKAPFIKNIESQEKGVLISWSKNTEIDLFKYELFRKNISDSLSDFVQLNLTELNVNSVSFLDRSFQKGTEFVYVLYALDSLGNKSLQSNQYKYFMPKEKEKSSVTCQLKQPKLVKTSNSAKLSWSIKPYTESVKYIVFRKSNGSGFQQVSGLLETNKYTDRTVENNQVYVYEIRCYLEDGSYVKSEQKELTRPKRTNKEPKK